MRDAAPIDQYVLKRSTGALRVLAICMLTLLLPSLQITAQSREQGGSAACTAKVRSLLRNGGALAMTASGKTLFSHRADESFIPASTLKIATVAAALDRWGSAHRFPTEFYRTLDGELVIKGLGDPGMVSEDLPAIAKRIAKSLTEVTAVVVDASHFSPRIAIDGVGASRNPYDARNGALLVNFNTVFLKRTADGGVRSAEPQTPLTPIAAGLGQSIAPGSVERINLGSDAALGVRYFVELLSEFLRSEGMTVAKTIKFSTVPPDAELFYTHHSSKTLAAHSAALLEYSTNFLANQVFLLLGVDRYGAPATVEKGSRAMHEFLQRALGWREFTIVEGAGLSRQNKISPRQMVDLLRYFKKHQELLPIEQQHFQAKTGSLTGVSSLAGYFRGAGSEEVVFAIFINDRVDRNQRFVVAKALRQCVL